MPEVVEADEFLEVRSWKAPGYSHRPNITNPTPTTPAATIAAINVASRANAILYPASARFFRASMSLTMMWRSLSFTAPPSSSLRNARVTATRLQPIIVPSCSWV